MPFRLFAALALVGCIWVALAADERPLRPAEARKQLGKKVTVEMTVKAAKDRLQKRGKIYLDSEQDFKDPRNFAVVITKKGAASLKQAGIDDPAAHFKGKKIRATGAVKDVRGVPRVEIDDARQITLVRKK
jgi:DNA/RNA endonuclease YhcR with UshA esterase domain